MISYDDICDALLPIAEDALANGINTEEDKLKLSIAIRNLMRKYKTEYTVLGFDIYKYSKYPSSQQDAIPVVFEMLYKHTVDNVLKLESMIFQNLSAEELKLQFIPTGDGGFQLFPTPIHALVFNIYFCANLHAFNASLSWPMMRAHLGKLDIRYAMSHGYILSYSENYFGSPMITNSRMLSADKLNRFLIDQVTNDWFDTYINGIATLSRLNYHTLLELEPFENYKTKDIDDSKKNLLFGKDKITSIIPSRIGTITQKGDEMDVYNIFLQASLTISNTPPRKPNKIVISLGNVNTAGIS